MPAINDGPSSLDYVNGPRPISDDALVGALPAMPGWRRTDAYAVDLRIGYGTEQSTAGAVYAMLARGSETIEVEIVDTSAPLARRWADSVTAEGRDQTIDTPIGRVFANGPTAVLDRSDRLLRATLGDGPAAGASRATLLDHLIDLQDRVRGIMLEASQRG